MTSPRVNVRLVVSGSVWGEVQALEDEIAVLERKLAEKRDDHAVHIAIAKAARVEKPEP